MDTDLRCNRLTCRKVLFDKAVVTTCSHIFCVDCANALFDSSRLCPACETVLLERDDVVVCSLNPTNDYKTSVLSGLSPAVILDICSRAIAFWQYQIHQENSFQQAVVRSLNDTNAQMKKQLEKIFREANAELITLNDKVAELERDLELERKRVRDLQEVSRNQEKEYQKLKTQTDKVKRQALLAPLQIGNENTSHVLNSATSSKERGANRHRVFGANVLNTVEAETPDGVEFLGRTPSTARVAGVLTPQDNSQNLTWQPMSGRLGQPRRQKPQRQPFGPPEYSFYAGTTSGSASEVENILNANSQLPLTHDQIGLPGLRLGRSNQRATTLPVNKRMTR